MYCTNPVFVNCASPAETIQARPYDQQLARITSAINVCKQKISNRVISQSKFVDRVKWLKITKYLNV